jgi:hypothetical protein
MKCEVRRMLDGIIVIGEHNPSSMVDHNSLLRVQSDMNFDIYSDILSDTYSDRNPVSYQRSYLTLYLVPGILPDIFF